MIFGSCDTCGLTVHPAAGLRDLGAMFGAACPRCGAARRVTADAADQPRSLAGLRMPDVGAQGATPAPLAVE